jgi:hypothetical protein
LSGLVAGSIAPRHNDPRDPRRLPRVVGGESIEQDNTNGVTTTPQTLDMDHEPEPTEDATRLSRWRT